MTEPVTYCNHPMSLVERKKQQWAKEREELARLGGQYREYSSFDRAYDKPTRYGSKPSLIPKDQPLPPIPSGERRGSLPPLHQNQFNSNYHHHNKYDRGGETSGYGSDSYPTPDYKERHLPATNGNSQWSNGGNEKQSGYESSSSYRDDRLKWGDKGVGLNKFWQAKEEAYEKVANDPPNWVKRGLEVDGAIVVANSSPSISPEQRYDEQERPCTGSSSSHTKTYIRGQNIPIDSVELAERERKRQMALAHQEAIRQQLEERERQRQEERARQLKEEQEEELRIAREQEFEKQRKLEEEKALQKKMEREKKRKQAIQEAVEIAEREAKLEKMKLKMQKQSSSSIAEQNISENVAEKEKVLAKTPEEALNNSKSDVIIKNNLSTTPSPTKSTTSLPNSVINESRSLTPRIQNTTPRTDQFTYLFQPTLESLQSVQYAVLIPTTQYPIAIPVPPHPESARTENRTLTPTRYRNSVQKCDSSTQTDTIAESRDICDKMSGVDLSQSRSRRSRSSDVLERPKWGVNRPPTRYLKQSEKDPLYQRRKKKRESANKSYDEKISSDDSQAGTPIHHRKNILLPRSRARWRTEERRVKMYQQDMVPLESNKDQLYLKCCCSCRCQTRRCSDSVRVDVLKIEDSPRDEDDSRYLSSRRQRFDVLEKLSTLHNGLAMEQEKWQDSPRSPVSSGHRN